MAGVAGIFVELVEQVRRKHYSREHAEEQRRVRTDPGTEPDPDVPRFFAADRQPHHADRDRDRHRRRGENPQEDRAHHRALGCQLPLQSAGLDGRQRAARDVHLRRGHTTSPRHSPLTRRATGKCSLPISMLGTAGGRATADEPRRTISTGAPDRWWFDATRGDGRLAVRSLLRSVVKRARCMAARVQYCGQAVG